GMSPYSGTWTWVSWISRLLSTVWTSGPVKSAIDIGRWTTIVVSGGIAIDISGPAYVAATLCGVNPAYSATITAPNRYDSPKVARRQVTRNLKRTVARCQTHSMDSHSLP